MKTDEATLPHCATSGCGWACCNYGKEGHIIMLPDEYENATGSVSHLEVIDDDYMGGKKVRCKAENTINCDGGYKPIQCGVYPFWVRSEDEKVLEKSSKCPLPHNVLDLHAAKALSIIDKYKQGHPDVDTEKFLRNAAVNKYEAYDGS